jgi:hypothetical protein
MVAMHGAWAQPYLGFGIASLSLDSQYASIDGRSGTGITLYGGYEFVPTWSVELSISAADHTGVWLSSHIRVSLRQWRRRGSNGTRTRTTRTDRSTGWPSRWRNSPLPMRGASLRKTFPTARLRSGTTALARSEAESLPSALLTATR